MSKVSDVMEECLKEHGSWIVKGDIIGWTAMKRDEVYLVDELEELSKIKGLKKEKQMKVSLEEIIESEISNLYKKADRIRFNESDDEYDRKDKEVEISFYCTQARVLEKVIHQFNNQ